MILQEIFRIVTRFPCHISFSFRTVKLQHPFLHSHIYIIYIYDPGPPYLRTYGPPPPPCTQLVVTLKAGEISLDLCSVVSNSEKGQVKAGQVWFGGGYVKLSQVMLQKCAGGAIYGWHMSNVTLRNIYFFINAQFVLQNQSLDLVSDLFFKGGQNTLVVKLPSDELSGLTSIVVPVYLNSIIDP